MLTHCNGPKAKLLLYIDVGYPRALNSIHHSPAFLWAKGRISLLNKPSIAMVGARKASVSGMALAKQFASSLGASGLTIVSGLALGINGVCHQGALDAQADTIAGGGLLVSPWLLMAKPLGYRFPVRNQIISGLSLGMLVVEAALRSGSLITAKAALEQGQEVFAVPSSVNNVLGRGCHQLIRDGAILVDQPQQVLAELAPQLRPLIAHYQAQDPKIHEDSPDIAQVL